MRNVPHFLTMDNRIIYWDNIKEIRYRPNDDRVDFYIGLTNGEEKAVSIWDMYQAEGGFLGERKYPSFHTVLHRWGVFKKDLR